MRIYQPFCLHLFKILLLNTHDLHTSINKRTHFFMKICTSHTSFSKRLMFLCCLRDEWRHGQTTILTQLHLLTIARCVIFKNPLSILAGVAQSEVAEGHNPQSARWFSLWLSYPQLTQRPPASAYILS